MEKVLTFLFILLLAVSPLGAATKAELADLNKQAKEKEAQLKKYKAQEASLSKELKNLTKKQKQAAV